MKYTKESLDADIEWFKRQGANTIEVDETLKDIIVSIISMSREEQIKLLVEVLQ